MMTSKPFYVIIPAYNEEENIEKIVKGLKQLDFDLKIIVVDDGSTDKTAEQARKAGAIVLKHFVNLGQWAALKTAFIISKLGHAEIIVTLDADGQHSPENLPQLVTPVLNGEADLVIGSRLIYNRKPSMPTYRYFGIKFFNILMRLCTGYKLSDCTNGYKVYSGDLIERLIPFLSENQYGALEAIIEASKIGARICEKPITSNLSNKTTKGQFRYAYNLIRTIINSIFRVNNTSA